MWKSHFESRLFRIAFPASSRASNSAIIRFPCSPRISNAGLKDFRFMPFRCLHFPYAQQQQRRRRRLFSPEIYSGILKKMYIISINRYKSSYLLNINLHRHRSHKNKIFFLGALTSLDSILDPFQWSVDIQRRVEEGRNDIFARR